VAVGVSGGRDSLALLYLLTLFNRTTRHPLDLVGLHVALDASGPTSGVDAEVARWCSEIGVPLAEVRPRLDPAESFPLDCFRCGRVRRRTLLEAADERGCRTLALGHHADDVVETWLLGLCYTGTAEALPPRRAYFDGVVHLVRPLFEIRQNEVHRLARLTEMPTPSDACSREPEARRGRIRDVLRAFGGDQRLVRRQLYWAAVRSLGEPDEGTGICDE
jgi:tRNA 2-thiocytidine biosynthesis protein TtcA